MAPVELETLIFCNCIAGNCSRNNCSRFKNNVKCVSWQAITLTLNLSFYHFLVRVGILCVVFNHCISILFINFCRFKKLQISVTVFMMLLPFQGVFLNYQFRLFVYFLQHFREHAYEFFC